MKKNNTYNNTTRDRNEKDEHVTFSVALAYIVYSSSFLNQNAS